jgi:flagellar protein FliL
MAQEKDTKEALNNDAKPKKSKLGLILVIVGILLAGGGGVAVGYLGLIPPDLLGKSKKEVKLPDIDNTVFITLPAIIIPLGDHANAKHLRAIFSIETDPNYTKRIDKLKPRLMDMLNTYLRAVEEKELTQPERFQNLQAQMLRRARLVAGENAIKNLLVQDFVLQ